ncbi:MAG: hypothetical protein SGI77_01510 [Pirellulaceae bacterium]|nr:hypothetical protein [Pirellulaceae bacterium]
MRLLCSSVARAFCSIFVVVAAISFSNAQDRSQVATAIGQPTLIVSISKIEQLKEHATYILRAVNQPEISGLATTLVDLYTGGLDRSRPIGVAVSLNGEGNPTPVVMLPISDLKTFFASLANFGEPEELGNGLYTISVGPQTVFAKQVNDWLIVAQQEGVANEFKQVPSDLLQNLSSRYDVGIKLDVQSIPAQLRDKLLIQMKEAFERANAQQVLRLERELKEAEAQASTDEERAVIAGRRAGIQVSQQIQKTQIEEIEDMIRNTKQVVIGLLGDSPNKQVYLEVASEFIAGSKLDAQIARSATAQTDFSALPMDGQTIALSFSEVLDPSQIPQIEQTVNAAFDTAIKNVPKSGNSQAAVEFIKEIKLLVIKGIQDGNVDGAASVTFQSGLNIVTASRVADGKQLAASLEKVSAAMSQAPDAPKIKFNAYSHQSSSVHIGTLKLPSDADEKARKIFSDTIHFAIATSDKKVVLALGSQAEANLKAALDRIAGKPATQGSPVAMSIEVGPLLDYLQSVDPSPIVEAMIQGAQNYADKDMLTIKSQLVPHGAVIRISIEEGVLRAIGAGAKAGQGNSRGGRF